MTTDGDEIGTDAEAEADTSGAKPSGPRKPVAPPVTKWASDNRRGLLACLAAVVAGAVARTIVAVNRIGGSIDGRLSMAATITLLVAYAVLLGTFAVATWLTFARLDPGEFTRAIVATTPQTEEARRRQRRRGTSSSAWLQLGAALALGAVAALVVLDELRGNLALLLGSLALVVVAWLLMMVSGTLMLVREDIGRPELASGLDFPGVEPRRWQDYAYLAMQICTTFSSSDVAVTTTRLRRAVTSLAATAFLFNTVIVALLVSMLLSAG